MEHHRPRWVSHSKPAAGIPTTASRPGYTAACLLGAGQPRIESFRLLPARSGAGQPRIESFRPLPARSVTGGMEHQRPRWFSLTQNRPPSRTARRPEISVVDLDASEA
ncbi:unnamed protein product [Urochloa humidicola]